MSWGVCRGAQMETAGDGSIILPPTCCMWSEYMSGTAQGGAREDS